jgi:hypothetical protein
MSSNQGFSYYFCMMIEESGESISQRYGSGSGRPKNMWIRYPDSDRDPQHW